MTFEKILHVKNDKLFYKNKYSVKHYFLKKEPFEIGGYVLNKITTFVARKIQQYFMVNLASGGVVGPDLKKKGNGRLFQETMLSMSPKDLIFGPFLLREKSGL